MRKKRQLAPSRLSGFHTFDQGNGLSPTADEGRYRDDEHTAVPEALQRASFQL